MRRLRIPLIIIGLLIAVLAGALAARVYYFNRDPGWRLVRDSFRQTYVAPASYVQTVEMRFGPRVKKEVFRVWQEGRSRKVVQVSPESRKGLTTYTQRPVSWTYAPGVPLVLKSFGPKLLPFERGQARRLFRGHVRAVVERTADLDGVPVSVVAIGSNGKTYIRLWIAQSSRFTLRQERYDRNGRLLDTTTNTDVQHALATVRRNLVPSMPRGEVTSDRARWARQYTLYRLKREAPFSFGVPKPQSLPKGFTLEGGDVFQLDGSTVVAMRFARHHRVISLFANRDGQEPPAPPRERRTGRGGSVSAYRRSVNGTSLILVGPLSEKEADRVFASLEWFTPDPTEK